MNLESKLTALKTGSHDLSIDERAKLACDSAKQLEKAGEYQAAYENLAEFWPNLREDPKLNDLDVGTQAEVLLRVGTLSGWLGNAGQYSGSQEMAKDLITRSIVLLEKVANTERLAEALSDLSLCYWREGSFDEARIHLRQALKLVADEQSELSACILIRSGLVELRAGQLSEALQFHNRARTIVDASTDSALKGAFHNQLATLYENLRSNKQFIDDYTDKALIEYAAASFHFEEAGNARYLASVENNFAFLLYTIGKYEEAHRHLDRARQLFFALSDVGMIAQVDETRARTLLAEGRLKDAEKFARLAVKTLEKGDEQALLAEALTTHGTVFARLGDHSAAKRLFQRAVDVAETTGDLEGAGRAKLSIIEELSGQTPALQLVSIYESAVELLKQSQDPLTSKRLIACAHDVIDAMRPAQVQGFEATDLSWAAFKREMRKAEKALLARALREAEGSVTKAAYLLGFKHHQSLISIINIRHKDLIKTRSRIRKRRRHIFSESRKPKQPAVKRIIKRTSPIAILHVEDNAQVAKLVADMFAGKNWRIESCADGDTALRKLTGKEPYDVLVIDNDLPGLNGLELVERARTITRRRRTPIIMLSATDCEREAWRAGVNDFLKKPEQIDELPTTVARLLAAQSNDL